jgi:hypothetical protein
MPHPLLDRHAHVAILVRSRSLRLRACEVTEHTTRLRAQAERLLATLPGPRIRRDAEPGVDRAALPSPAAGPEPDDVEALHWYRAQVRQMLAAGWSRAELAEVGVTDALLRELGLDWSAAG